MNEEERKIKHREYLKEHEGLRYLVNATLENVKKKWLSDYSDDKYDEGINLCEVGPKELVIEFDEKSKDGKTSKKKQRKQWIKETIKKLKEDKRGYELFKFVGGKCPHIHTQLNRDATKEEKERLIKYYVPKEAFEFADLSLCGKHLIATPYTHHWKYNTIKELVKEHKGDVIDVDDIKYKDTKIIGVKVEVHQETTGITKKIIERVKITDLAEEYGLVKAKGSEDTYNCPFHKDDKPSFSLNNEWGRFKCYSQSCAKVGNIIDFVSEMENISKKDALRKLIVKAGLENTNKYDKVFSENKNGNFTIDYRLMAEVFLLDQPYFYDRHKIWWFWNHLTYKWEMVDDIDVMNEIDKGLNWSGTIDPKIKGKILESLKRVGRLNTPKEPRKTWVQFKEIIVDIETGETHEVSPKFFITNPIPWEIGENEDTPNIDKIFIEWVGEEYLKTLKEIMAYCCLSYMPIHRVFCLIGVGLNGKGSFLRLVERLVGEENATSTSIERLAKGQFETSKLYKKLVAIIGEIDKSIFYKTALLKALSGDDLLPIEFKGKDSWNAHLYATPIIATNTLPETSDKSKGFYRRWTIVDFPNQFNEKKDILKDISNEEIRNFCRQVPKILKELLERGEFTNDGTIEDREIRYKERSSPVSHFIRSECELGSEFKIPFDEFYDSCKSFLEENEDKIMSENLVGRILTQMGYESKVLPTGDGGSRRYRIGLRLKGGN